MCNAFSLRASVPFLMTKAMGMVKRRTAEIHVQGCQGLVWPWKLAVLTFLQSTSHKCRLEARGSKVVLSAWHPAAAVVCGPQAYVSSTLPSSSSSDNINLCLVTGSISMVAALVG